MTRASSSASSIPVMVGCAPPSTRRAVRSMSSSVVTASRSSSSVREARAELNAQLRAAYKEDPSSLSADDCARAEQLLARDARKAAKKAARSVSSETPPSPPPSESA